MHWARYGLWAAHLYDGERQQCRIAHGNFAAFRRMAPRAPTRIVELSPHGTPYGKVCTVCLRAFRRAGRQP